MNFAQLECSETSVLGFIDQHGYLRMDAKWELAYQRRRAEVDPTTEDEADNRFFDAFHFFGESIEEWYSEIRMMRFAIDLWAANREQSSAKQLVALVERHQRALEATHNGEQFRSQWRSLKTPREALATVHSLVLSRINGGAFDHTLSWSFAEILPHNRYILEITPESLGVGLWLQLATSIAADAHYRQCEFSGCRGFFDAENCRKSRRYCSDSCKTRAYNKRQMTR